jgi:hypothetical protein
MGNFTTECILYNRMETDFYDKRHLFSFSGEDKVYTPGKEG